MLFNIILASLPFMDWYYKKGGEDPGWGPVTKIIFSGLSLAGGLAAAHFLGGNEATTVAIASFSGSAFVGKAARIFVNPQPFPPTTH